MVKLIYGINRKPGMSGEEFQRYWRATHAPTGGRSCETPGEAEWARAAWTRSGTDGCRTA